MSDLSNSVKKINTVSCIFKLPPKRLQTWKYPADGRDGGVVRNQIDYLIINKRFKKSIKSARTYLGADIPMEHSLLQATIKVKLEIIEIKKKGIRKCFNGLI